MKRKSIGLMTLLVTICLNFAEAQDQSVRPGVNKSFEDPDVTQFVERFEREGREVYDHRQKIVDSCGIRPGMVVADIGAGTGLFTRLLSPKVGPTGQIIAVDIAKSFVDHVEETCRENGLRNVKGIVCTPDSSELPENSIDLAFICDVYHHFEFPYKTMRSIYRALRPGGHVVLVEFHRIEGKSTDWIMGHVRAGKKTFVNEIELAGFEVVEDLDFLKTSYFTRFKKSERKTPKGHTTDSLEDVTRLLDGKTAMLIDVREQKEWDAGHLKQAKLVPLSDLRSAQETLDLPKDKIIYCHCRSGGRVLVATEILKAKGYDIRPLSSGFSKLAENGFEVAEE